MKKIKGILLFGILTLLGIGSSFGTSIQSFGILKDVGSNQFNGIFGIQNQGDSYPNMYVLSGLNSIPFTFNSHSFGIRNNTATSSIFDYGINGFRFRGSSTYSGNVYFNNGFDSLVFSNGSFPNCLLYDSVNGGYFAVSSFDIDGVYQSVLIHNGEVLLTLAFASNYRCIYGVGNSLSILNLSGSSSTGDLNLYNVFTDSDGIVHIDTGYAIIPIYNTGNDLSGSGVLVISSDSPISNLVFNYYDVFSSNPAEIVQGNLINKGYSYTSLSSYDFFYGSFLAYSNTSYSNISKGFYPFFCFLPNGEDLKCFSQLNYIYSNNNYYLPTSNIIFPTYNQGVYSLTSNSSAPVIDLPSDGGNGDQSVEPIFDYNTSIVNDLIICYITSGDVCVYDSFNRSAFESTFDVSDSVWNGTTGFLLGGNAYLFLKEFCLNSSLIDYPYCSQLDLYSGSAIFIDYANGLLSYQILGDGVIVSINGLGSGQLGDTSCWGGGCSNINTGLPNFIYSSDVDYYTGDFIDTGYFENFYNLNITGYFMRCPFSYNSNRIVIGKKIMDHLGDRDPFVFVNCMIAGFNKGKSFNFLDRLDFPGPLMSLGSDYNVLGFDTDKNKRLLFGFFDLLLSLGLLLFIRVFYRLFS